MSVSIHLSRVKLYILFFSFFCCTSAITYIQIDPVKCGTVIIITFEKKLSIGNKYFLVSLQTVHSPLQFNLIGGQIVTDAPLEIQVVFDHTDIDQIHLRSIRNNTYTTHGSWEIEAFKSMKNHEIVIIVAKSHYYATFNGIDSRTSIPRHPEHSFIDHILYTGGDDGTIQNMVVSSNRHADVCCHC